MNNTYDASEDPVAAQGKRCEQVGFTFCRIGTMALIALAPHYALLGAAVITIYFYLRAMQAGVTRSDCLLRHPLLIIAFWFLVALADLAWLVTHGHSLRG
jgi:hypothetical protein